MNRFPNTPLLSAALSIAATCSLTAQQPSCGDVSLNPNVGTAQSSGDEVITAGLNLGFPFTFPDGTVTSIIDVTSNGRITLPGSLAAADFGTDNVTFLTEPSALAPLWVDLDFITGDVFFNTTPTSAIITWQDAVIFGGTNPLTFQAILNADNTFSFIYDSRTGPEIELGFVDALVGVTPGNGAADPGDTDLSLLINGTGDTGSEGSVYEFYLFDTRPYDITGFALSFAPNGSGGYTVTSECARSVSSSDPCALLNDAFRFIPNGLGGYDVSQIERFFETNIGPDIGLTDEDESDQPLPFPFTMPGGTPVSTLRVTSNGRLLDPASGTISSFFIDPADAFTDGPGICAGWVDLDATDRGSVHFDANATRALITWQDIPEFLESNSITFQARLFPDGSFEISYLSFPIIFDGLIGAFDGAGGAVTPEFDLSASSITGMSSPNIYEFFDLGSGDESDISIPLRTLEVAPPQLGGTYDLMLDGIPPTAITAGILVGFFNPNIDIAGLLPLGVPSCILATDGSLNLPVTIQPDGTSSVSSINVPNMPALAGVQFESQGFVLDPTLNPFALGFGNGLSGRVGL